jgi:hypothetical protein
VTVLARLQRGLEALYRVETQLDVHLFVVSEDQREQALNDNGRGPGARRKPREQLLVSHHDGELSLGLYLDAHALANLEKHDPGEGLGDHNFGDFCLAVEGVSHFIYVARCAAADRQVTALELELQAEVDKFVSCLLIDGGGDCWSTEGRSRELRARLYDRIRYHHDLESEERGRYQTANDEARSYTRALEERYLRPQRQGVSEMLIELRRFYRLSLEDKLGHIARAAV